MRSEALLATVPSYFSLRLRIVGAWGLVLLGLATLAIGRSATQPEVLVMAGLGFIGVGANAFGTHLYSLRMLGRRHRWPSSEWTQVTCALLGGLVILCLVPGALVGSAGFSGIGVAAAAWAAVGLAVAFSQLVPSIGLFVVALHTCIFLYPSAWPSPAKLAMAPSAGTVVTWGVLGALGWFVAVAGLPFSLGIRRMVENARDPAETRASSLRPLGTSPRPRAGGSGALGRMTNRFRSMHLSRFASTLAFASLLAMAMVHGPLEPFGSAPLVMPLLLPTIVAVGEWERRMPQLKREALFPLARRDFAKELTGGLMAEVFVHWVIIAAACAVALASSSALGPGALDQVGFYMLATLLLQPVWMLVLIAFLGVRPDRVWMRVLSGAGVLTVATLILVLGATSRYAWLLAVAPGSSVWKPWLTLAVVGFGAFVVAACVEHFDRIELGRLAAPST
ncbi:MAG: hypothetical protein AAFX50_06095 [Acidobacteriota bacterium]